MKKLFCIGDFTVDLIIPFGDMKRAVKGYGDGKKRTVPKIYTQAGGGIANTSVVLARLGQQPRIVSKIGTDSCGLDAIRDIKAEGVNTDNLILDKASAFIIGSVVDEDGERYFNGWQRSDAGNGALLKGETEDIDVSETVWVHSGGINIHDDTEHEREIVAFLRRCKEAGATVSFDINLRYETSGYSDGRRRIYEQIFDLADIILGSGIDEFGPVTGIDDLAEAGRFLVGNSKTVVVRNSSKPVLLINRGQESIHPTCRVQQLHTIGAGDSFDGGFIAAAMYGKDMKTCVEWGNRCAAATISHMAPMTVPTLSELENI